MAHWFNKQSRLLQILLLLIPGVNWVVEVLVRWSAVFARKNILNLVIAIITLFGGGLVLGWIDLVWVLLYKHLVFAKA